MGIAESRLSLPIAWAHWARSLISRTNWRSTSSIFWRQPSMSITYLPRGLADSQTY
jgi:hypothetical protein